MAFDGNNSTQVLAPISGTRDDHPRRAGRERPRRRRPRLRRLARSSAPPSARTGRKARSTAVNTERIATRDSALYAHDGDRPPGPRTGPDRRRTSATADQDAALDQLRAIGVDSATIAGIRSGQGLQVPRGIVRAPIAGQVVERLITAGQLLQAGTTQCFTIAQLDTVWVMAKRLFGTRPPRRARRRPRRHCPDRRQRLLPRPGGLHRGGSRPEHQGHRRAHRDGQHRRTAQKGHVRAGGHRVAGAASGPARARLGRPPRRREPAVRGRRPAGQPRSSVDP